MQPRAHWFVGLGLIALVAGCGDSSDETHTMGFVSVQVVNGDDPVSGVEIAIAGTDRMATTGSNGRVLFRLPAGDYFVDADVCCAGPGYIEYHEPVVVEAGRFSEIKLEACLYCVCASPETPIATPQGDTSIDELKVGDLVYSIHQGQIVVVPIARTNRVAVRAHRVVRVLIATGTTLEISPGHPTADGRTFGELRAGDQLGGVTIIAAELVTFSHDHTCDILPASDSGVYFAGGVAVGSTLYEATLPDLVSGPARHVMSSRSDRPRSSQSRTPERFR